MAENLPGISSHMTTEDKQRPWSSCTKSFLFFCSIECFFEQTVITLIILCDLHNVIKVFGVGIGRVSVSSDSVKRYIEGPEQTL